MAEPTWGRFFTLIHELVYWPMEPPKDTPVDWAKIETALRLLTEAYPDFLDTCPACDGQGFHIADVAKTYAEKYHY